MKVLITDPLAEEGIKILKDAGFEILLKPGLNEQELKREIKDVDALIVRSGTKVTAEIIAQADNLKIIGRAGVGLDNVDVEAATRKGIIVMNTPFGNTISTAEHTMALILALSRNIPQADNSLREKRWERKKFMGLELYGKVLGIVGLGKIGSEVAKRASGFGMKIIAYDPYLSLEKAKKLEVELIDYEKLLRESDFITFHVPLTNNTRHMFSKKELEKVKDGVRIVNCSRGGVVDEEALYQGLISGKIAGAALDVYEKEPPFESKLLEFKNVVLTPHLGASTEEAQINVAIDIAKQLSDALLGHGIRNAVNVPSVEPEVLEEIGPYLDLAEKLGSIQGQLLKGHISQVRIKYSGEVLDHDVKPITISLLKGLLTPILQTTVNYVNAPRVAKERGINVEEIKSAGFSNYRNLIYCEVETEKDKKVVAGTLFTRDNPRVVIIDNFYVEAIPYGYMLIVSNLDKPGVIGHIGMVLGKRGVNIAGMSFGRESPGGNAITVLNLDSEIDADIISEIISCKYISDVKLIKL